MKRTIYGGANVDKVLRDIYKNLNTLNKEGLYEIRNKVNKKKIRTSSKNIFLSKDKKTTNDLMNNIRLTFAIEKQHSLKNLMDNYVKSVSNNNQGLVQFAESLNNIEAERIKFRCSWIEYDIWRVDSTITVSVDYNNNLDLSLTFETEIEFDLNSYTKMVNKPTNEDIISGINKLILQYMYF